MNSRAAASKSGLPQAKATIGSESKWDVISAGRIRSLSPDRRRTGSQRAERRENDDDVIGLQEIEQSVNNWKWE